MRTHTSFRLAAVAIAAALALSGCGSDDPGAEDEAPGVEVTDEAPEEEAPEEEAPEEETPEDEAPEEEEPAEAAPGTEGLSQEAIDQGYTATEMPSGWPDELPLPEGTPVMAMRSGESFYITFDLASVEEGERIMTWFADNGWTLESDVETDGIIVQSWGSAETNDYGPLRRVTLGLGMIDWPTGFQYYLEVAES